MNKLRALLFALLACVLVAPMAFAADFVGGANVTVPPGVNTIGITVSNDADLRGLAFSYTLQNIDAASATVNSATVLTADLGQRRTPAGAIYLAGRNGADDLAANPGGAVLVNIEVDVQGVTGNQARLIIGGASPNFSGPQMVDATPEAGSWLLAPDTIIITLQALATADIDAVCPADGETYEGGAVAIAVGSTINPPGLFVSLDLIGMLKDGIPTAPANAPKVVGLGLVEAPNAEDLIFYWEPAAGEAGSWDICFEAADDVGNYDTSCVTVVVGAPGADHVAWNPQHFEFTPGGSFAAPMSVATTHGADSTFGVVLPFKASAAGAASFVLPWALGDLAASAAFGGAVFESISFNIFSADAQTGDSLLMGAIDFGGPALSAGTYGDAMTLNATLNDAEGIIMIDTVLLPPANQLTFNVNVDYDASGAVTPTYADGCFPVTIVRNIAPTVACPVSAVGPVVFGNLVTVPGFTYNDPDGAPGPYTFSVVSIEKDGNPAVPINAPGFAGDVFNWQTAADDADVGVWTFCVQVNDGAENSTNTCCFDVTVIGQTPFQFCLDNIEALNNQDVSVCVNFTKTAGLQLAGGFDLLICYDATVLTFTSATIGQALLDNNWEYWTYRLEGTNPGKIRIVAIADMNNSNHHPTDVNPEGVITCLNFHTSNDRTVACQKAPIRFCWEDCGDNTVSERDGYTLYVASLNDGGIIDVSGEQIMCNTPDPWGYNATVVCDGCPSDKYDIVPFVTYCNGSIRIICPGEIDDRGDINLNGLAYEIADAVLFSNYLIYGDGVLDPAYYEAQIAAMDVNNDGIPGSLTDLVYLIRVITGDAQPIADPLGGPKVAGVVGKVDVVSAQQGSRVNVTANSESNIGAGLFVFSYANTEISNVTLAGRASGMDVTYAAGNGELRVLVYNIGSEKIAAGNGEILNITTTGAGQVELISVEAASFMGGALESSFSAKMVPTTFALHQNYPNPFNPSTSMALDFPNASDYTLSIYNIAGQVVKTYAGHADAGRLTITWDGTNNLNSKVASGVYFYRAEMGSFSAVKKMVLMK